MNKWLKSFGLAVATIVAFTGAACALVAFIGGVLWIGQNYPIVACGIVAVVLTFIVTCVYHDSLR